MFIQVSCSYFIYYKNTNLITSQEITQTQTLTLMMQTDILGLDLLVHSDVYQHLANNSLLAIVDIYPLGPLRP